MTITVPHTFATQGAGNPSPPAGTSTTPASWLDDNFNAITAGAADTALSNVQANQITTNQIFAGNGALVQRFNDVVRAGGATVNPQVYPQGSTLDWLSALQIGWGLAGTALITTTFASLNNTNSANAGGVLSGAQSKFFTVPGTALIGDQAYGVLNHSSGSYNGWARYSEIHRLVGASGTIIGHEIDTRTLSASQAPTPYQQGDVIGLQLAEGAGISSVGQFNGSAAIQIVANNMAWRAGIVVGSTALDSNNYALLLGTNHRIQFLNAAGFSAGSILSTATGNHQTAVNFTDNGMQVAGADTSAIAYFNPLTSGANYLIFAGNTTNNNPIVAAGGSDTNVSLILRGQGTGGAVLQDGALAIKFSYNTTGIGFYATAPVAKQTVSGAKGGNVALASLMTALATLGLVTDSTT